MIVVIASLHFANIASDTLIEASRAMGRQTLEEAGCLGYNVSVDINDGRILRLAEIWRSREDLEVHFRTPHMKAFRATLRGQPGMQSKMVVFDATQIHFEPPSPPLEQTPAN